VLNGTDKEYFESGLLMRETPYVDGKKTVRSGSMIKMES